MKTLLGIEVSDDYFDELFCGQAQGKTIVARNGQLVLEEPEPYVPSYRELRREHYPDFREYLDAQVKLNSETPELIAAGQQQLDKYYQDCLLVKQQYPKPAESAAEEPPAEKESAE